MNLNKMKPIKRDFSSTLALLWSAFIMLSYYLINFGYYEEKFYVFGKFFLAFI